MKGVVLAGGTGSRLRPLTDITNKHLLPVYDKPMLFYPLELLASAGIKDVLIVVGGHSTGEIIRLCGDGKRFDLRLSYVYQEGNGGIADALRLAKTFTGDEDFAVVLGDNIFERHSDLTDAIIKWQDYKKTRGGMHVILKQVDRPQEFGCPKFYDETVDIEDPDSMIDKIIEKPEHPTSPYAVVGVYLYDRHVYKAISRIKPSARGELEISDVNNWYANMIAISHSVMKGWWGDAGYSIDQLYEVSEYVRRWKK